MNNTSSMQKLQYCENCLERGWETQFCIGKNAALLSSAFILLFSPELLVKSFDFSMPSSGKGCSSSSVLRFVHGKYTISSPQRKTCPKGHSVTVCFGKWLTMRILPIFDTYLMHRGVC